MCSLPIMALLVGVVLVFLWLAAYFAGSIGATVWAWIDDATPRKDNPVISWAAKIVGYSFSSDSIFGYVKDTPTGFKHTDSLSFLFGPMIFLFSLPFLVYFYEVSMFAGIAVACAFMGRMHLRQKKLLAAHIADKDAHK